MNDENVHEGAREVARVEKQDAAQTALHVSQQTRALLESRTAAPFPSVRPLGLTILLVLSVWLFVSQWALIYPFTIASQNSALRELGFAVVISLSAIWLRQLGPNRVAVGLLLLSGVLLMVSGVVFSDNIARVRWNEIATGAVVLVAAVMSMSGDARLEDPTGAQK